LIECFPDQDAIEDDPFGEKDAQPATITQLKITATRKHGFSGGISMIPGKSACLFGSIQHPALISSSSSTFQLISP
jgi:hypothetical protein